MVKNGRKMFGVKATKYTNTSSASLRVVKLGLQSRVLTHAMVSSYDAVRASTN